MTPPHDQAKRRSRIPALAILIGLGILLGACGGSAGSALSVGDRAPDFTLPTSQGGSISLADYSGVRPALLYFHMAVG